MKPYRKPTCLDSRAFTLLVAFTLLISACGPNSAPTAVVVESTMPPEPSLVPEPTESPVSHEPIITLSPNITDIKAGDEITILLSFDPPVGVEEAKWDIVVGSGTIKPPTGGDAVVYTAPEDGDGNVIIKVSGKTTDGDSFEKNFTFKLVPLATPTPLPDCEFQAQILPPPSLSKSDPAGAFTTPARCTNNIKVGAAVTASGTARDISEDVFLWLFVYPRNARYYPQCNDASSGLCGANYDGEVWGNTVYLGDPGGFPTCKERFFLILASVDKAGNDFLIGKMKEHSVSGYVGFAFAELPGGIKELARLEVETAGSTNSCP